MSRGAGRWRRLRDKRWVDGRCRRRRTWLLAQQSGSHTAHVERVAGLRSMRRRFLIQGGTTGADRRLVGRLYRLRSIRGGTTRQTGSGISLSLLLRRRRTGVHGKFVRCWSEISPRIRLDRRRVGLGGGIGLGSRLARGRLLWLGLEEEPPWVGLRGPRGLDGSRLCIMELRLADGLAGQLAHNAERVGPRNGLASGMRSGLVSAGRRGAGPGRVLLLVGLRIYNMRVV
jgi:hypothetical protein